MEKVLIIDDEEDIVRHLKRVIAKEGFEVLTAGNGREGLEIFREQRPGLIITDIAMPEVNGMEVLRQVKKLSPSTEVIVVTGHGDYDTAIEVLREAALDYIKKPIDLEKLLIALDRYQEKSRSRREDELRPRVLLLDDDEDARNSFARFLIKEGYQVHKGADGEEGLRLFSEHKIDVVITDIQMPKKNGIELLREIKKLPGNTEVILITGHGNEDIVIQAMHEGAHNFLRKPVDIEHLIIAVEKAYELVCMKRSLARRTRDLELAQKIVGKLTERGDIVVDLRVLRKAQGKEITEQLFDLTVLPIVVIDRDMNFVHGNKPFVKIFDDDLRVAQDLWAERLPRIGIYGVSYDRFQERVTNLFAKQLNHVDIIQISQYAYIIFSRLTVLLDDRRMDLVAAVFRGERK